MAALITTDAPTPEVRPAEQDEQEDEVLSIAEVAERMGVTAHTLRYYERIGLLDVPRDSGGRRRYTANDIARVHFITCLRKADMPIGRIQHYFELVEAGPDTEPERLALLEAHRQEVLDRQADLQTALDTIEFKITMYGGQLGDKLTRVPTADNLDQAPRMPATTGNPTPATASSAS